MYESKREPGRKFGSAFVGKRFDSFAGDAQPGEANENEHSEPQKVAAEHGPAHQVIYHHDEEKGEHKVTSFHDDGHMHQSVHSSAGQAYEAGGDLAQASPKRRNPEEGQQGAESEELGFEAPETV
jgi:hypothetical protein